MRIITRDADASCDVDAVDRCCRRADDRRRDKLWIVFEDG